MAGAARQGELFSRSDASISNNDPSVRMFFDRVGVDIRVATEMLTSQRDYVLCPPSDATEDAVPINLVDLADDVVQLGKDRSSLTYSIHLTSKGDTLPPKLDKKDVSRTIIIDDATAYAKEVEKELVSTAQNVVPPLTVTLMDLSAIVLAQADTQYATKQDWRDVLTYDSEAAMYFDMALSDEVSILIKERIPGLKLDLSKRTNLRRDKTYIIWAVPLEFSQDPFPIASFVVPSATHPKSIYVPFPLIFVQANQEATRRAYNLFDGSSSDQGVIPHAVAHMAVTSHARYYEKLAWKVPYYDVNVWRISQQLLMRRVLFLMTLGLARKRCNVHERYVNRFKRDNETSPPTFHAVTFWRAIKISVLSRLMSDKDMRAKFDELMGGEYWFRNTIKGPATAAPDPAGRHKKHLATKLPIAPLHLIVFGLTAAMNYMEDDKLVFPALRTHMVDYLGTWFTDVTPLVLTEFYARLNDEKGQDDPNNVIKLDSALDIHWKDSVAAGPPYVPAPVPKTLQEGPLFQQRVLLVAALRENATRFLKHMDPAKDMLGERTWLTNQTVDDGTITLADAKRATDIAKHYASLMEWSGSRRYNAAKIRTPPPKEDEQYPQIQDPVNVENPRFKMLHNYARYVWFEWHKTRDFSTDYDSDAMDIDQTPSTSQPTEDESSEGIAKRQTQWVTFLTNEIDPAFEETRTLTQLALLLGDRLFFQLVFDALYTATPLPKEKFVSGKDAPLAERLKYPQVDAMRYLLGWLHGNEVSDDSSLPIRTPLISDEASVDNVGASIKTLYTEMTQKNVYSEKRQDLLGTRGKVPIFLGYDCDAIPHNQRYPYDAIGIIHNLSSINFSGKLGDWAACASYRGTGTNPKVFTGPASGLNRAVNSRDINADGGKKIYTAVELPSNSFALGDYVKIARSGPDKQKSYAKAIKSDYFGIPTSLSQGSQHRLGQLSLQIYQKIITPSTSDKSVQGTPGDTGSQTYLFEWPQNEGEATHVALHALRLFMAHRYLPSTPLFDMVKRTGREANFKRVLSTLASVAQLMGNALTSNTMQTLTNDCLALYFMAEDVRTDALQMIKNDGADMAPSLLPDISLITRRKIMNAEPLRLGWHIRWDHGEDAFNQNSTRALCVDALLNRFKLNAMDSIRQGLNNDIDSHLAEIPTLAMHTFATVVLQRKGASIAPRPFERRASECGWIGLGPMLVAGLNDDANRAIETAASTLSLGDFPEKSTLKPILRPHELIRYREALEKPPVAPPAGAKPKGKRKDATDAMDVEKPKADKRKRDDDDANDDPSKKEAPAKRRRVADIADDEVEKTMSQPIENGIRKKPKKTKTNRLNENANLEKTEAVVATVDDPEAPSMKEPRRPYGRRKVSKTVPRDKPDDDEPGDFITDNGRPFAPQTAIVIPLRAVDTDEPSTVTSVTYADLFGYQTGQPVPMPNISYYRIFGYYRDADEESEALTNELIEEHREAQRARGNQL